MRNTVSRTLLQFTRRLPARYLVTFTFALFLADLLVPDMVPFADELLLALLTLLFGAFGKGQEPRPVPIQVAQDRV